MSAIILNCTFHTRIFPLSMSKNSKDLIMLWMLVHSIFEFQFWHLATATDQKYILPKISNEGADKYWAQFQKMKFFKNWSDA